VTRRSALETEGEGRLAMSRLNVYDARCEALFASGIQRSDAPTADAVREAITRTVRKLGCRGCAAFMAQEFGDHPEMALARMRWVRQVVDQVFATDPRVRVEPAGQRSVEVLPSVRRVVAGSVRYAA
jgi:hypothetical protein